MGFPVDYTDVFVPKIFINLLFLLSYVRSTLHSLFHLLGLSTLHLHLHLHLHQHPAASPADQSTHQPVYYFHEPPPTRIPATTQLFNDLIKEYLPAVIYSDEQVSDCGRCEAAREMCVVCLYGIEVGEEVRWLKNCKHVFHRTCIDRWMDYNQRSCPLCRTGMVPRQVQDEFNQRLWGDRENDDDNGGGGDDFVFDDDYSYLI